LRGDAAIDDEAGAGHEAGIVRGEKDEPLAMSVAVPMRPIGMRFNVCWRAGSRSFVLILRARIASTRSLISGSIVPDGIELTRIRWPLRANSSAADLVNSVTPALDHRIEPTDRRTDETDHGS
jgi:hypothetical protein